MNWSNRGWRFWISLPFMTIFIVVYLISERWFGFLEHIGEQWTDWINKGRSGL